MKFIVLFSIAVTATAVAQDAKPSSKIDFVKYGSEIFHSVGCAECHSEIKNDVAVKTGPGLYGLFQKTPRSRDIIEAGENHRHTVTADFKYFKNSLRKPHAELAIAESGVTKGDPYLPIMPPYDAKFISENKVRAIYQYLLTLNDEGQRGPAKFMAFLEAAKVLTPETDPSEILVSDQTRIYRARLGRSSARAISVGTPSGLNYTFDPRSLSIERIWWGGFLNITNELKGRAGGVSVLGHQAKELPLREPLFHPLHPVTGKAVDLSFKSPISGDYETIAKNLNGEAEFLDQLEEADADFLSYQYAEAPLFSYRVGGNKITLSFIALPNGEATISLQGKLSKPQTFVCSKLIGGGNWVVDELPARKTFTLPKPTSIWRPQGLSKIASPQKLKSKTASSVALPVGYEAESLLPPLDRYGRAQLFEPMGMAEMSDGSIIMTTRTAGIWKLQNEEWTQIAEGTLDALGVIVEEDCLIVAQKPELTRLKDTDGDGVMDFYETLSDDFLYTSNYHEYLHGPAKGSDGNYYIQTNLGEQRKDPTANYKAGGKYMGTPGGYRAWSLQISPDGKMTPFAHGLRSPAGLGQGPDGQLYYSENQGEFVGTSKLFLLQRDKFYGHPSGLVDLPGLKPESPELQWEAVKARKEKALVLLPHSRLANSPGSPVWETTGGKFSPFEGDIFMGDQTLSNVFRIIPKHHHEGAVIPFAHGFPSGVMRLLFSNGGALYAGQTGRGWRAKGGKNAALVRISRNENALKNQLKDVTRLGDSFTLHFTQALAASSAKLNISSWHYLDTPSYGSPETGKREEKIMGIPEISADKKSLTIRLKAQEQIEHQRVYWIRSKNLPPNKGSLLEAFYTRSPEG